MLINIHNHDLINELLNQYAMIYEKIMYATHVFNICSTNMITNYKIMILLKNSEYSFIMM